MAGSFQRFLDIFRGKANKALDRMEDPRDTLDLSYERQVEQLTKVRRGVADVATARKRIELQAQGLQKQADKLQSQAKAALSQGNEDLAREALSRRAALGEQLAELKTQHDQITDQEQKLVQTSQELQIRVERFRTQTTVMSQSEIENADLARRGKLARAHFRAPDGRYVRPGGSLGGKYEWHMRPNTYKRDWVNGSAVWIFESGDGVRRAWQAPGGALGTLAIWNADGKAKGDPEDWEAFHFTPAATANFDKLPGQVFIRNLNGGYYNANGSLVAGLEHATPFALED